MSAEAQIQAIFPRLLRPGSFFVASPLDQRYNCIAYAAGDMNRWWEPSSGQGSTGHYWPPDAPREYTVHAYALAYGTLGYAPCLDGDLQVEVEKVAVFAENGVPTHAARQLADGSWVSKLGQAYDIVHEQADDIGGSSYGEPVVFLARPS